MTATHDPSERAIVVTGADHNFFSLLEELLASVQAWRDASQVDLGCYDLGLTEAQVGQLQARGVRTVRPWTGLVAPALADQASNLGYLARPFLPENFPGYATYIWLDADTWIQSGEALQGLLAAARQTGAACIREDEPTYKSNLGLFLWKCKHYVLGYGPWKGLRLLFRKQINNGVFAMRADAPHWAIWRRHYQSALSRTGLAAPHDQFALNVAVYLGGIETHLLPATFNWICDLSRPDWDDQAGWFCSPDALHRRIEVIHLAGPIKTTEFDIRTTAGGVLRGRLRYGARLSPVAAPG